MLSKTSFNETYDIVCHMEYELYKKIPQSFLNFIKQNMVDNYEVNIDYTKSINNQKIQKDTRTLLSLIYRDYLCGQEKRDRLLEIDKLELERIENDKKEKYNPDNVFKNVPKNKEEIIEYKQKELQLIELKKENIFQKIIDKIKKYWNFFNDIKKIRSNK